MTFPEIPLEPIAPSSGTPETVLPVSRPAKVWKFWGTTLWGLFVFAALFAGQLVVLAWFVLRRDGPLDLAAVAQAAGSGSTISLSVIMGLPAVLAALWLAIRLSRTPFADYLALRAINWRQFLIGVAALLTLVLMWEGVALLTGHEASPGFMVDVLKTARKDGALWLLVVAFTVAAPVSEELLARGFLYRGWSETALRPVGAIILSSLVWTAMHFQYDHDWFLFCEVLSIGVLFGYLRYWSRSLWLGIILHGLNNLAAVVQSVVLAAAS
jgi:membrane protease YdiL (CAAX protease family)